MKNKTAVFSEQKLMERKPNKNEYLYKTRAFNKSLSHKKLAAVTQTHLHTIWQHLNTNCGLHHICQL